MGDVGGRKGQHYPSNSRIHRKFPPKGPFAEGATVTIASPITEEIAIAGDNYTRIYFKADVAGTLEFEFLRPYPDKTAVYDTKAVPDVATLANTEKLVDIPVEGESRLLVTFTADATGLMVYADVAHNWGI